MTPVLGDDEPVGDIQFYDNYLLGLALGDYQITVQQDITYVQDGIQQSHSFKQQQAVAVAAPRFSFQPGEIHTVFPPPNAQGQFEQTLPHIVLTERALPWARTLQSGQPDVPWLALLVLDPADIIAPADSGSVNANDVTGDYAISVSQLLNPEADVFRPLLQLQTYEDPNAQCRVIDISPATFTAVTPRLGELEYLAHCREVNTGNKVIEGIDEQGWFAVVISNRFPSSSTPAQNGAAAQPGSLNIAHLVSLEGLADYLVDAPSFPAGTTKVRLASLANWVFTCLPEPGQNFANLMRGLIAQAGPQGNSLLLRLPQQVATSQTTPAQQAVNGRLGNGYVPLGYRTRQGEQTFAWYRGPLVPAPTAPFSDRTPFQAAGEAAIYDPATGIFDHSYAAAWQIGRQLALSDQSFAMNLLKWRRTANRLIDLLRERLNSENLQTLLSQAGAVADLNTLLEQQLITQQVLNNLVNDLQPKAPAAPRASIKLQSFSQRATATPTRVSSDIARLRSLIKDRRPRARAGHAAAATDTPPSIISQLQTLLQDPQVQTLLQNMSTPQNDPTMEQIAIWLARLSLLYDVPFAYLVPNPQSLPAESIRFFYVDQNWLDCAIDGALSVGVQSSRDSLYNQIMRDTLNDAAADAMTQLRDVLVGLTPAGGQDVTGGLAGFLLRSAVVSGWPGLEVRAYGKAAGGTPSAPIRLLRMERLAPDVLICLFPEVPAWVECDEPQEGFHFGVEDNKTVGLRSLSGSNFGQETGATVQASLRPSSRVLDVAQLVSAIQTQLSTQIGPAGFAVQMVAVPEQMVFENPS